MQLDLPLPNFRLASAALPSDINTPRTSAQLSLNVVPTCMIVLPGQRLYILGVVSSDSLPVCSNAIAMCHLQTLYSCAAAQHRRRIRQAAAARLQLSARLLGLLQEASCPSADAARCGTAALFALGWA